MKIFPTIFSLMLGFAMFSQSNCDCDVTITNSNQNFPINTGNKTICFQGDFTYQVNFRNIGNKTTLCIGEGVTFNSQGLNWPNSGNYTIINSGTFNMGNNIPFKNNTTVENYGQMNIKANFNGGSLTNYSGASLFINSFSNFDGADVVNQANASFTIADQYTSINNNFNFNSLGDFTAKGSFVLASDNFNLEGNNTFEKDFTNNSSGNIISGPVSISENLISNGGNANISFNNQVIIGQNLNVFGGDMTFQAGVEVANNTQINGGSSVFIEASSNFNNNLTIFNGAQLASNSNNCKTVFIGGNALGSGGQINANNNAILAFNKLNQAANNEWITSGDVIIGSCPTPATIWEGTVSTDANNPDNWSNGLPSTTIDAIIPSTQNNPILSSNLNVLNLEISANASLSSNGDFTINVYNNIEGEGDINLNNANLNLVGETTQNLNLSGEISLKNLVVSNSRDVELTGSSIDLYGILDLIDGNLITNYDPLNPNQNLLTFKSNAVNTAMLAPTTNSIVGNVMIERYIPAQKRAFRYITSSVNSSNSIKDNWQEGQNNTINNYQNNLNNKPGFGTHITGSISGDNGFDATLTGNSSLFNWDIATNSWQSVSNTDQQNLIIGDAYSLLIRGDRSTNLYQSNNSLGNPTTLRMTGELVTGDVDLSSKINQTENSYSLIGNPYQAQVDLKTLIKNESVNVDNKFYYAYNPNIGNRGGYVTVDLNESPVEVTPAFLEGNSNSDKYRYIQPNQSVFIKTTAETNAAPSLVFKESYKILNTDTNEVFRGANTNEPIPSAGSIYMNLVDENLQKTVDGVKFKFSDNFSTDINSNDASKLWNTGTAFSILNNQNYLSIEKRAYPLENELVNFWIGNYTSSTYKFQIKLADIENRSVYLIDNYTDSEYELTNNTINEISFTIDANNSASSASNRFNLRFSETTSLNTDDVLNSANVQVYPNPVTTNFFEVKLPQNITDASVSIYNGLGQLVASQDISQSNRVSTQTLRSGVYFLEVSSGESQYKTKLIIK